MIQRIAKTINMVSADSKPQKYQKNRSVKAITKANLCISKKYLEHNKRELRRQMKITKKIGIWLMIAGVAFQFINIITYGLWEIDIDILGALIFIVGLILFLIYLIKRKRS